MRYSELTGLTLERVCPVTPLRQGVQIGSDWKSLPDRFSIAKSMSVMDSPEKSVDANEMTAMAIINTDAIDYENAVILPSGVRFENYSMNPVVLWEHGLSNIHVPLGVSNSNGRDLAKGELTVLQEQCQISAKCYFSKKHPDAIQIFGLIDEGIIRATSIQVIPSKKAIYANAEGQKFDVTEESDACEWSFCCMGVNYEAVIKSKTVDESVRRAWELQVDNANAVLERGSVGTDRLTDSIRRSLKSLIPARKPTSPGFEPEEETKGVEMPKTELKSLSASDAEKLSRDELEKVVTTDGALDVYDEPSKAILKSLYQEIVDDDDSVDESGEAVEKSDAKGGCGTENTEAKSMDSEAGDDEETESEMKAMDAETPTAKAMGELYRAFKMLTDMFETKFSKQLDVTPQSKSVLEILGEAKSLNVALEGVYGEAYPDYRGLGDVPESEQVTADDEFSRQLKSLLSGDQRSHYKAMGIVGCLRRAVETEGLPSKAKSELERVLPTMQRLTAESKSFVPALPENVITRDEHEKAVSDLQGKLDAANEALTVLNDAIESEKLAAT